MRDWSRRSPAVAERLREVDNQRMNYLRSLFAKFCSDRADVEARSILAFSLAIANHFIAADHPDFGRLQALDLAMDRLLR